MLIKINMFYRFQLGRAVKAWKDERTWKCNICSGAVPRTGVTPILPGAEHPLVVLQAKGMRLHRMKLESKTDGIFMPVSQQLYLLSVAEEGPQAGCFL